jgi:DMSO/TMAO reductase YedYZ molybdopterin-dependent catalytic subunit
MQNKPGILMGAFIGGLLMLPIIAISFLGQQVAELPFVPAVLFAFGRDSAPGNLVPSLIGVMSSAIISLNVGRVDVVAKQVEYVIELSTLFILGIVLGGAFFAVRRRGERPNDDSAAGFILGAVLTALIGVMLLFVPQSVNSGIVVSVIWIAALSLAWGFGVNSVYNRLAYQTTEAATPAVSAQALNRRQFLIQVGAASATITVIGAGLGALLTRREGVSIVSTGASQPEVTPGAEIAALPNADDPVIPAPGTRPEVTPLEDHYRIDISTLPPRISPDGYMLPFTTAIDGGEQTVAELTLDDIRTRYEPVEAYITMSCISNQVGGDLISTTKWTGVPMQRILAGMEVPAGATHLKITAADGFDETVALDLINSDERVMLAYMWEDQPLTVEHGFPLRIHIPNHFGMKQPKWITGMEFIAGDQDGYWVRRGWDKEALVRTTSVIDTVATSAIMTDEDGQQLVPVGGIAYSGARGISRVEVRVDGGDWVETALRAPISDRTWYLWRYDWPFQAGDHTFEVRCYEEDGTPQIDDVRDEYPSGATGINTARASL